jgi:hypothetical protein
MYNIGVKMATKGLIGIRLDKELHFYYQSHDCGSSEWEAKL